MLFNSINLENELQKAQNPESNILNQVLFIFNDSKNKEDKILSKLNNKSSIQLQDLQLDDYDKRNLYDIDAIEKICIKYRLRFLETKHFKPKYPYEAILKIKQLEKKYGTEITNFKILAPQEVFKLNDVNADPLLFAQISSNQYLLLHKWGNDLAWYRSILKYPLRGIMQFVKTILLIAFLFQLCIPLSWMGVDVSDEFMMRLWFTTHCFIGFFSFSLFLGSLTFTGFSANVWQSKYFN